ncbi:MAG: hypothetical protein WD341_08570 [Tistlia sp.]|uniref:hypothetical protein n=1 Tax=Tistlia sp. TaxID=3057121 RepID=UPI0034A42E58
MAILRHLIGRAVQHVASDPRARAKAEGFLRDEVAPRAREAARQGRDAAEVVRDDWRDSAQDAEGSAARRAGRFLGRLHNRLNEEPRE